MPLRMRLRTSYRLKFAGTSNFLAIDFIKGNGQNGVVAFGIESRPVDMLALRVGVNSGSVAGPGVTAGFGVLFPNGSIDYAFVPMGNLGNANRISATYRWGGTPPAAPAQNP